MQRLKLTERANIKSNTELFSWNGFYSDSISVKDSLIHSLTLLHAGLIAVNPKTGAIKSWVGGIDFAHSHTIKYLLNGKMASAFKPILYATALQEGARPCQYLDNDPIVLTDFENWQPQNYDHSLGGKYSIAASLPNL